jgi:hypothetical protein
MPDFAERIRFPKVTQISQNVSDFAKRSRSRTRELYLAGRNFKPTYKDHEYRATPVGNIAAVNAPPV